jgi:hypothetical protein
MSCCLPLPLCLMLCNCLWKQRAYLFAFSYAGVRATDLVKDMFNKEMIIGVGRLVCS